MSQGKQFRPRQVELFLRTIPMPTFHQMIKMQIEDLAGETVSSISFVMDYFEIIFNNAILRCLGEVEVSGGNKRTRFPEIGSRDHLCELIGKEVDRIDLKDGQYCKLYTTDGWMVSINLKESKNNPEAMHFVPEKKGPIQVW